MCKGVKSNAILVSRDHAGIGMGPGQPNRVDSALIACKRAHEACERMGVPAEGLVCASDAFFPFRRTWKTIRVGVTRHPSSHGGSIRDEECIQAANEHGIAMVFTGGTPAPPLGTGTNLNCEVQHQKPGRLDAYHRAGAVFLSGAIKDRACRPLTARSSTIPLVAAHSPVSKYVSQSFAYSACAFHAR